MAHHAIDPDCSQYQRHTSKGREKINIKAGLRIRISEMDVRIRELPGTLPERLEVQAQTYRRILTVCLREKRFEGVTFWGFTDKHSWVHKTFGEDNPLLFDDQYRPKPAYQAVRQTLLGK